MKLTPEKLAEWKALIPELIDDSNDHMGVAHSTDMPPQHTVNFRHAKNAHEAAWAITNLIADLEEEQKELENERARGIHTCHDNCTRDGCVNRRLRDELADVRKQLAEATAARGNGVLVPSPKLKEMQAEIRALRQQLAEAQAGEARALADMDQLCESGPSLSANEFELIRMTLETRPSGSAALDAAIAEAIEKYRKDAERLDWLEKVCKETPLNQKAFGSEIAPDTRLRYDFPTLVSYDAIGQKISIRDAIDAAIAAKGETNEPTT